MTRNDKSVNVTVIICCYNSQAFIRETLDSAMNQTLADKEIIVVDDGSTDDTMNILKEYEKISIVTHPGYHNRGKSASLNLGLASARGEFVAFLDHDDIWLPRKIERQIEQFESDEDIALVYCDGNWLNCGQVGSRILGEGFSEPSNPVKLLMDCYILSASAVMVRKRVFNDVGLFDEDLVGCDDHDMWLRIAERYRMVYLNEPLYHYRIHDAQLSSDVRMWMGGRIILDKAKLY